MRNNPFRYVLIVGGLSLLTLFGLLALPQKVVAASCSTSPFTYKMGSVSRDEWCGFFSNTYNYAGDGSGYFVLSAGLPAMNLTQLIADMQGDLTTDPTGASFIVRTMLGDSPASGLVTIHCSSNNTWCRWKTLVTQYDQSGLINYNYSYDWSCGKQNTYYKNSDVGAYTETSKTPSSTPCGAGVTIPTIAFMSPNNGTTPLYVIKKNCGNPVGALNPLLTSDWTLSGGSSVSSSSAPSVGRTNAPITITRQGGDTVTFYHDVKNNGRSVATYSWKVQYSNNGGAWTNGVTPGAKTTGRDPASGSTTLQPVGTVQPGPTQNDFTIPAAAINGTTYCQRIWYSNATGPATGAAAGPVACVKVQNPPPTGLTCGSLSPSLQTIQPGDQFTFTVGATGASPVPPGSTFKVSGDLGSLPPLAASQNGSTITSAASPLITAGVAKDYTVHWELDDSSGTPIVSNCSATASVVGVPYFKVFGGNVIGGDGFTNVSCPAAAGSGQVGGFTQHDLDNTKSYAAGAGSQLLAASSDWINGLTSGALLGAANASPTGLTVANDTNGAYSYGGQSGLTNCLNDYYGTMPSGATPKASIDSAVASGSGDYRLSGNQWTTGETIASGRSAERLTIYVNGNVYISGNITYQNPGGWGSATDIPSLTIIAKGNVYIAANVTELDGVYIAQPNTPGTDGIINDCVQDLGGGNHAPINPASLYQSCNSQLVVYGSFMADHIDLLRTYGSLKDAVSNEAFAPRPAASCTYSAGPSPTQTTTPLSCAGEVFMFSPESYLAPPSRSGGLENWQAVTGLPPVL